MPSDFLRPPLASSYWVDPGRLLAGEYPGGQSAAETLERIQRLLQVGIDAFVDLTVDGELPGYVDLLPEDIEHHRWPIEDHGLPRDPRLMVGVLDTIEDALARGRNVYVHCRAGIGRTGTAVGCYLTRGGLTGAQALERLQSLWVQSARSVGWPSVPETDEQHEFVLGWSEEARTSAAASLTFTQRAQGAMLGLAVGDALATALAEGHIERDSLDPAAWPAGRTLAPGPETVMTLVVAESLLARGGHDADDQMARYVTASRQHEQLLKRAEFKRALASWQWSGKANAGTHDPKNLEAHSVARSLAAALWLHRDAAAVDLAADVSRTTQQSPVVLDVCRLWTALLVDALHGEPAVSMNTPAVTAMRARRVRPELGPLLERRWQRLASRRPGALSACARALETAEAAPSFAAGMLGMLDASTDATSAALYGSLAGALHGVDAIPAAWMQSLAVHATLPELTRQLTAY
jgi:protein-tyrosine phosphatase/ADP-ribosylglycohydrolase